MRTVVALCVLVLALLLAACDDDGPPSPVPTATLTPSVSAPDSPSPSSGNPSTMTMEDVYREVQDTLSQPGMIYRAVITEPASSYGPVTTTLWADAAGDVARREVESPQGTYVAVIDARGQYMLGPDGSINVGNPRDCPGATVAAAAVLDCPNEVFETYVFPPGGGGPRAEEGHPTIDIQQGGSGGREIVIRAHKEQQPFRSGPVVETRWFTLDVATFLPRAVDIERSGEPSRTLLIDHDFVAASSVAVDFFDPTALRFARPDPEGAFQNPPPSYPVYWLGTTFRGAAGVPPLVLWKVERYDGGNQQWDGDQFTLSYVPESDPYGQQLLVRLTLYTRSVWDALPEATHGPPDHCWEAHDLALPGGSATIYSGFDWPDDVPPGPGDPCPANRPRNRFFAHAFLGETVVVVEPWDWPDQSFQGVESLTRNLGQRAP